MKGLVNIFLLALCLPPCVGAQQVVEMRPETERIRLDDERLFVHIDSAGTSTLVDVRRNPSWFKNQNDPFHCSGYQKEAYWGRFVWSDQQVGQDRLLEISEKSLDNIELYVRDSTGVYRTRRAGDVLAFDKKEVRHRNFLFVLSSLSSASDTTFFRIKTSGPMCFPSSLWSLVGFHQAERSRQFVLGAFFGLLGIMLLYNLLIFLSLQESAYGYYVLYIGAYLVYQISVERIGFEHLWPNSTGWEQIANNTFGLIVAFLSIQFARSFLDTKNYAPTVDKVLRVVMVLCLPLLVFNLLVFKLPQIDQQWAYRIVVLFIIFTALLLLAAAIIALKRNDRAAGYYIIAWSFLIVATIISMLAMMDILQIGPLRTTILRFGSALELTFLSLAIGYKFKLEREMRAQTRQDAADAVHTELGHHLTDIQNIVSKFRHSQVEPPDELDEVELIAQDMHRNIRDVEWLFDPDQSQTYLGLKIRTISKVSEICKISGIENHLSNWQPDPETTDRELDPKVSYYALQIVAEIANNAVRHARCQNLYYHFKISRGHLFIEAWDDGVGIDSSREITGKGVQQIRHKAESIGGHWTGPTNRSAPDHGTHWSVRLPMRPNIQNDKPDGNWFSLLASYFRRSR